MRNAAVRDCGKTRNGAERDRQTLSELRDQCRNVGATSLLDLDLHPNVAGIGTLHCLCTFKEKTCQMYPTRELEREQAAQV